MNEINSICRLCLTSGVNLTSIFNARDNLAHKIHLVTGVMIIELKSHITNARICKKCYLKVTSAFILRRVAKKADEYFRKVSDENEIWQKELGKLSEVKLSEEVLIKTELADISYEVNQEDNDTDDYTSIPEDPRDDGEDFFGNEPQQKTKVPPKPRAISIENCPFCNLTLNDRIELRKHMIKEHPARCYTCDYCGRKFHNSLNLYYHFRKVHHLKASKVQQTFKCPTCNCNLGSTEISDAHVRNHHKLNEDIFQCSECGKLHSQISKLKNHMTWIHKKKLPEDLFLLYLERKSLECPSEKTIKQEPVLCSVCAKVCKNRSTLTAHEKTHRVLRADDYYYCDLCGNKFKLRCVMAAHIMKTHVKPVIFCCSMCPKTYTRNNRLQDHIKVDHYNIREFQCQQCPKVFGYKKNLKAHMRVHNNDARYQCKFCGRRFIQNTDCRRHMWSHTGRPAGAKR